MGSCVGPNAQIKQNASGGYKSGFLQNDLFHIQFSKYVFPKRKFLHIKSSMFSGRIICFWTIFGHFSVYDAPIGSKIV